jgi:hypothetical protein
MSTTSDPIFGRILTMRGQRVILDSDLAQLYGVPTKRFNEAFKRNAGRFPADFAFRLTATELTALRSQFATLKPATAEPAIVGSNWSQIAASSKTGGRGRHRKYLPWAFTEHGALMAANVLRSPRAAEMSVYVVRAFVRLRREMLTSATLEIRLTRIERDLMNQNTALRALHKKISPLLLPDVDEPTHGRKLGFHRGNR